LSKILLIAPHYPPSNMAAVHRSRLFAQHLPSFGWEPIVLMVDEKFYEEELDWNLHKLLPNNQKIEKVNAVKITRPRIIGDIGLRAFFQLRKKALQIVKNEKIDFVYIPIPSFYVSLIGKYLNRKTGVKFGIDYIDPWVHQFPGSDKLFSRHWLSTQLAKILEPRALRNVSLITGVAQGYYKGVIERNPKLKSTCVFGAMPYGGEAQDHRAIENLPLKPYLFQKNGTLQFVYAGAMLPKAYQPLEELFKAIAKNKTRFQNVEFHFVGTGSKPTDPESYNIKPLAEKYGLWKSIVHEYPKRIPYLDVLVHLKEADAVFILGSTEPHYTPSKTYQAVLSQKPIWAILHEKSMAAHTLKATKAATVLTFDGEVGVNQLTSNIESSFNDFVAFRENYNPNQVDLEKFDAYSAKNVTQHLVQLLNKVT
jgi:glycosyltransferase involved in cell wall biosynthesis